MPDEIPGPAGVDERRDRPGRAFYVGELKGFPAPIGESKVWRIAPNARNAKCGHEPALLTGARRLHVDHRSRLRADGRLYVAQINDAELAGDRSSRLEGAPIPIADRCTPATWRRTIRRRECDEVVSPGSRSSPQSRSARASSGEQHRRSRPAPRRRRRRCRSRSRRSRAGVRPTGLTPPPGYRCACRGRSC